MIDLYTTVFMPILFLLLLLVYAFISIIEYRHKQSIFFHDQLRKIIKRNVKELPRSYQLLFNKENNTIIEFKKPGYFKMLFKKLHINNFYTKGEKELLFDNKNALEL